MFDVLNELYRHTKFGEDCTMRAGCRCDNVVFVFLPAVCQGNLSVLNLLSASVDKNQHFRPCRKKKLCTGRKVQKSAKKVCAHHFVLDHSVARQFVHYYKGDAASQWEMAIVGVSELRNS